MSKLPKAHYRVVRPIIKSGRQRQKDFTFHACTSGVHVRRWLAEGRIVRVPGSEVAK